MATYAISLTCPDGTPYRDTLDASLHSYGNQIGPTEWTAYGEEQRDQMITTATAEGYTVHVRPL